MIRAAIRVCVVLLAGLAACQAQDITGTITGVVKDATGAVVPGARVVLTNNGTQAHFDATADDTGTYTARAIPIGVYTLAVTAPGFKNYEATNIRLQVNEVLRLDVSLDVGASAETVTVRGEAVTVDTTTQTLKTVVDQKRIEELPLNGRNPTQLMRLVAGVVSDPRADVTSSTRIPALRRCP